MREPAAPASPWVIAGFAALRTLGGFAFVFGGLVLIPDSTGAKGPLAMVVVVIVGLAMWGGYLRYSVRAIRRARYPKIRSGETLLVSIALFLAIFAAFYVTMSAADQAAFSEPLDHFTAYYFSLTILATVGFGDITPITNPARAVTMLQMAIDLFIIGVAVRILGAASDRALKERESAQA